MIATLNTKRTGRLLAALCAALVFLTCTTAPRVTEQKSQVQIENEKFMDPADKGDEVFRVLYTSDKYTVAQRRALETIVRQPDEGGDTYICNELKQHDKFNEARESVIRVWLYPDSGKVMKIRPIRPTFLIEIDQILLEDVQRWNFTFPRKVVHPTRFDIRYRVVLQQKLSDEEIMKDIREKLKEKRENR